jgi:hypothetical protein
LEGSGPGNGKGSLQLVRSQGNDDVGVGHASFVRFGLEGEHFVEPTPPCIPLGLLPLLTTMAGESEVVHWR